MLVALCALFAAGSQARAQASRLSLHVQAGVALMLSDDQLGRLRYDQPGLLAQVALDYEALSWLDGELSVKGGAFFSDDRTGGLLSPAAGLRLHPTRKTLTPYASFAIGPAFTGPLVRPRASLALGCDIKVRDAWTVGPVLGVDDVVQWNGPRYSSDAVFLYVGLSVAYRAFTPAPPPVKKPRMAVARGEPPVVAVSAPSEEIDLLMARTFERPSSRVELLAPVLFALDSDRLEPIGIAMLHEVSNALRERPEIALLEIQGYADERGDDVHNTQLSRRRAERVRQWLLDHGIADKRLRVAAHGAQGRIERAGDEAAHEQNRRVVFRVIELQDPARAPGSEATP